MKKIAITGSNGFIGSYLARKLMQQGFNVTCLVRHGSNTELLPPDSNIKQVNYNHISELKHALEGCDILIHSAALTRAKTWQLFHRINVKLTEQLVEIFNQSDSLKQFVFISSQAAAGPTSSLTPKNEDDCCQPISMYGKSKLIAENIIREKAQKPWTIIRPVSVFGPGEKDFLQYFKLIKSRISILNGFRKKYVSLIYVDDLVNLIICTLGNNKAHNHTFFAADGEKYSWEEFVTSLEQAMNTFSVTIRIPEFLLYPVGLFMEVLYSFSNKPPVVNREKVREMKQNYWLVSNEKACTMLGFKPSDDIVKNLRTTYEWYRDKKWL